ncbi:MAG: DUF4175 family protein [Elusimicrobia bacterium]|nr:DUF4175 family protein [Elusimicrobiota bacterium]
MVSFLRMSSTGLPGKTGSELAAKTARWRADLLGGALCEGLARLLTWPMACLAAGLAADRFFALPQSVRLVLLAGGGAALLASSFVLLVLPFRRFDWGEVLARAQSEFPGLRHHLKTAWDLRRVGSPHTSEELRDEHLARTDALLRRLPDRPLFSWKPSRWARAGALAAVAGAASLPWLADAAAWQRVMAPWRDAPLESYVAVSPADALREWGKPVTISAKWTRRPGGRLSRAPLELWLRGQGSAWRRAEWDASTADGASYGVEELTAPVRYRIAWRDLETRTYALTPVTAPAWRAVQARVRSPRGAVTEQAVDPGSELKVMRGSFVTMVGEPSERLDKAVLRVSGAVSPIQMRRVVTTRLPRGLAESSMRPAAQRQGVSSEGGEQRGGGFEGGFLATEDATFHFELTAADGRVDPRPEVYRLKALADQPPKAELLSPTMRLQASRHDAIPIAYGASDDLGVSRVALRLQAAGAGGAGSGSRTVVLREFGGEAAPKDFLGDYALDLGGLPDGAKVEFQIEVQDNGLKPQTALSAKGIVELVDFESAHEDSIRRWASAEGNVQGLLQAHGKLGEVFDKLSASTQACAASDLEEVERRLSGLPGAWKITSQSVADLAAAMSKDAYANPGLAEAFRSMASELDAAQKGPLGAAAESARRKDWAQARQLNRRLSAKLRGAMAEFASGRQLANLQDFNSHAGRMSQSADNIESALEAARQAQSSAARSEALRMVQQALSRLKSQLDQFGRALAAMPDAGPASQASSRREIALPLYDAVAQTAAIEAAIAAGDFEKAARLAKKLAEDLSQMQQAIRDAAAGALSSSSNPPAAEKARELWSEVVEDQSKSLDQTQSIRQRAMKELLESQKALLAELAARQRVLVSSGAAPGRTSLPGAVLGEMRLVLGELESSEVAQAPVRLRGIAATLRQQASREREPKADLEYFADEEDAIRRALEGAPHAPPAKEGDAQCLDAASRQASVRGKTQKLQAALESLEAAFWRLPEGALERVEKSQVEQSAAEGDLGRGDSSSALSRQEEALRLLDQGLSDMQKAMQSRKMTQTVMGESFDSSSPGRREGRGGRAGADTGFVPLPGAKDYVPPREIRSELERSLRERRPRAMEGVIKEYFKRIAQ